MDRNLNSLFQELSILTRVVHEQLFSIVDVFKRVVSYRSAGGLFKRGFHINHLHKLDIRFPNRDFEHPVYTIWHKILCFVDVSRDLETRLDNPRTIHSLLVSGALVFHVDLPILKVCKCICHHSLPVDLLFVTVPQQIVVNHATIVLPYNVLLFNALLG